VAGYVAKDATKSTEGLGVTLDHRIGEAELEELDLPAHVAELDRACFELGSRRYSTTLSALRRPRASFAARRHESVELARQGLGETVEAATVLVLARWRYLACGYQSEAEAWLARSAADARVQRRIARLELAMA
jgi:hypothetical protein